MAIPLRARVFCGGAQTFDKLFGPSEIGIRLPSALAMVGGMLLTYDCARRITDSLHGLIAMAVLTCSFLTYYGYEGRSYGLFFLFAAAVLWAWIGNRSAIVLAALFFFGVLIHYYLVLCLIPFAAEEAYKLAAAAPAIGEAGRRGAGRRLPATSWLYFCPRSSDRGAPTEYGGQPRVGALSLPFSQTYSPLGSSCWPWRHFGWC